MAFIFRLLKTWWQVLGNRLVAVRLRPAPAETVAITLVEPEVPPEPSSQLPDLSEPASAPKRRVKRDEVLDPVWHFKASILDRLDEFFSCVKRVRRHDPYSYKLLSKTGLAIPADAYFNPDHPDTRAAVRNSQYSFGGMLMTAVEEDDRRIHASFMYFHKLTRPSRVEGFRGAVYALTVVYDNRASLRHWRSDWTLPLTCYIGVTPDGEMRLLKQPVEMTSQIRSKSGKHCKRREFTLRSHHWQYPLWVQESASDRETTPNDWATGLLAMALVTYAATISKIVIRVKREGCVAAFGIDVKRGKYFFADRDVELARDGRKKRIFHSVVAHDRQIGQNRVTRVRDHYRGLRDFMWNAYEVHIVWPKFSNLLKFDKPARYLDDLPASQRDKYVVEEEAGRILAETLSS